MGHLLAKAGWQIRGTTRTPEKLADEIAAGWQVYPFSDSQPLADVKSALDGVDALVSTITAIGGSDPVLDAHGETLRNFTGWTGYVSATSIYPDKPQGFCYEDTPPEPATARGLRPAARNTAGWICWALKFSGRQGFMAPDGAFDGLRDGTARIIEREGQVFNESMLRDICRIITAAMAQPRRGRIINLADEKPAPQGDVVRCAAKLLGVAPPEPQTLEEANLSAMARSFYVSRRRVGSTVIKPELGLDLLYPDYESGLPQFLPQRA